MGAIASGGAIVMNDDIVDRLGITHTEVDRAIVRESRELARREARYREGDDAQAIRNRVVILVDDGMATGASMLVAIRALRALGPRSITAAVPVASRAALSIMRNNADDWACVLAPEPFHGVGSWYEDFEQTTDDEVRRLLSSAQRARATLHTPV